MQSNGILQNSLYTPARILIIGKPSVLLHSQYLTQIFVSPIAAHDNSLRNKACDFVLQGFLSKGAEETLLCLTSGSDWVDEQNFTVLHKIATGLSMADLEENLLPHLDKIDALDAMGRTALTWAAARADSHAVALLLAHGADPNVLDIQWTNAVSYAAERNHLTCVRLLLEAGAAPDPILPKGVSVGSALNCASRSNCDPLVLKTLLDFGADTEASGVEKITPLIHTARTDNVNFAMLLLEYGADINAATAAGQTALTTAITLNSHNVLRLLLDRWYEYSTCPRLRGPNLLETAALYADIETIKILTATDHFKLKYDKTYNLVDCVKMYTERFDVTDEGIEAFRDLISVLDENPAALKKADELMEAGLVASHIYRDEFDDGAKGDSNSDGQFEDALEKFEALDVAEKGPLVDLS
jgi:ankyrin repeat protein